jgi:hypothetical protein
MGRFARSWAIAKASGRVLRSDKELLVIPVVGFVCTMAVVVLLGGAAWISVEQTVDATTGSTEYSPTPVTYAVGVVGYLLATFVGIFFTSALVGGAYQRLTGGDPTIGSALAAAGRRIGPIFLWSLVVTTVGLILQAIEERAGILGTVIANLVGMAWKIVTWLAIPIIVVEGTGPFASLKRSGQLFKKTWGENIAAQVGFGLLALLLVLGGVVVGGGITALLPIVGIPLLIVYFAAVALTLSALNGIYRAALYIYASTGRVPDEYPDEVMAEAFAPRTGVRRVLG